MVQSLLITGTTEWCNPDLSQASQTGAILAYHGHHKLVQSLPIWLCRRWHHRLVQSEGQRLACFLACPKLWLAAGEQAVLG